MVPSSSGPAGRTLRLPWHQSDGDLGMAVRLLYESGAAFVIVKDRQVVARSHDRGLRSLLDAVEALRTAAKGGTVLADRIVGRAAAVVAVWGYVRNVHGAVMSQAAAATLRQHRIGVSAGRLVPGITNREGTGPCPLEAAVGHAADPAEAVTRLKAILRGTAPLGRQHDAR